MPRRTPKKERGVFERVPDSGIWWIRYKVAGVEHREKVGRRGDAIKLYAIRKADILRGMKMRANVKDKGIKFKVIAQEAVEWYINHERKEIRHFKSRMALIVKDFGERIADDIKPSEIDGWLGKHAWRPATKNRYKNVFGKTYKIALADGRVTGNPARLVEQRAENNSRIRYLLAEEESRLREVIAGRFPIHLPSFDIALNTGMRKQEQFNLEWSQVSLSRRRIHLTMTKNGSTREIPMNRTCQQSFQVLHALGRHEGRIFQSKYGKELNNPRKWFELALEEAKIENFRWHDLRHTFISRLVMKDVNLRTIQELAGHKTISMTTRYAHLAPEHNQAAVEARSCCSLRLSIHGRTNPRRKLSCFPLLLTGVMDSTLGLMKVIQFNLRQASQNNVAMHSRSGFNLLLELVQEKSINRSEGWLVSGVGQWKLVRAACVVHMLPYGLRRSTRPLSRPDVAGDPHGQIDGTPALGSRLDPMRLSSSHFAPGRGIRRSRPSWSRATGYRWSGKGSRPPRWESTRRPSKL